MMAVKGRFAEAYSTGNHPNIESSVNCIGNGFEVPVHEDAWFTLSQLLDEHFLEKQKLSEKAEPCEIENSSGAALVPHEKESVEDLEEGKQSVSGVDQLGSRWRTYLLSLKQVKEASQKIWQSRAGPAKSDPLMTCDLPGSSPAKSKKPDNSAKLPERYEILDKLFGSLDSSLRLLRIKGSATTFSNIAPKMECLTDRRFTHSHLAQIKYILPEAMELKKILVHDERTCCMRPDIHVSLDVQKAVQNDRKSESKHVELRKVFRSRLVDFFKAHPEGDEIPEGDLPFPFNPSKENMSSNLSTTPDLIAATPPVSSIDRKPVAMSHFAPSFAGRFSRMGKIKQQEKAVASVPPVSMPQEIAEIKDPIPARLFSTARSTQPSPVLATLVKDVYCSSIETASYGTPSKLASTPSKPTSHTPMLQRPKRSYMSPDGVSTQPANKLARRPSRGRSLKFDTPVKNEELHEEDGVQESSSSAIDSELLDILPDNLIKSIMEKEKKALSEQDPAISQAKWRQQMLLSLPQLFDTINFLYHSSERSRIKKDKLMHKIISSQVTIVDRREIEDQLKLLLELVPERCYEMKAKETGDIYFCVNKISEELIQLLHKRLAEAK